MSKNCNNLETCVKVAANPEVKSRKEIARKRWGLLAKALKSPLASQPKSPTDEISLRRFSTFNLLTTELIESDALDHTGFRFKSSASGCGVHGPSTDLATSPATNYHNGKPSTGFEVNDLLGLPADLATAFQCKQMGQNHTSWSKPPDETTPTTLRGSQFGNDLPNGSPNGKEVNDPSDQSNSYTSQSAVVGVNDHLGCVIGKCGSSWPEPPDERTLTTFLPRGGTQFEHDLLNGSPNGKEVIDPADQSNSYTSQGAILGVNDLLGTPLVPKIGAPLGAQCTNATSWVQSNGKLEVDHLGTPLVPKIGDPLGAQCTNATNWVQPNGKPCAEIEVNHISQSPADTCLVKCAKSTSANCLEVDYLVGQSADDHPCANGVRTGGGGRDLHLDLQGKSVPGGSVEVDESPQHTTRCGKRKYLNGKECSIVEVNDPQCQKSITTDLVNGEACREVEVNDLADQTTCAKYPSSIEVIHPNEVDDLMDSPLPNPNLPNGKPHLTTSPNDPKTTCAHHLCLTKFPIVKSTDWEPGGGSPDSGLGRLWYRYTAHLNPQTHSVVVGHPLRPFTAEALTGFNNTGNVCVWPSEEALAYYVLRHLDDFRGRTVLELGAGMSALAGLMAAKYGGARRACLTDGNLAAVENIREGLVKNGLSEVVECRVLKWEDVVVGYDVILSADCLFFDDSRLYLIETLWRFISDDGVALIMAPRRGDTLGIFVERATERGFRCEKIVRYDEAVWGKHQHFLKNPEYDEDIHYPVLLKLYK